jgi:DNA invertase Pin-like site-specific DNA recombinase
VVGMSSRSNKGGTPLRMVGYCRVSTDRQAHSGLGLSDQKSRITTAADREGWTIVAWKVDRGETGKDTDRPEFRSGVQMIADDEADGLVAAKLDRICRSVIDFAEVLVWFTSGAKTLSILDPAIDTSTSSGRLVANVFAAVAEWEADVIADRTADALAAKRAAGLPICRPSVADDSELTGPDPLPPPIWQHPAADRRPAEQRRRTDTARCSSMAGVRRAVCAGLPAAPSRTQAGGSTGAETS